MVACMVLDRIHQYPPLYPHDYHARIYNFPKFFFVVEYFLVIKNNKHVQNATMSKQDRFTCQDVVYGYEQNNIKTQTIK